MVATLHAHTTQWAANAMYMPRAGLSAGFILNVQKRFLLITQVIYQHAHSGPWLIYRGHRDLAHPKSRSLPALSLLVSGFSRFLARGDKTHDRRQYAPLSPLDMVFMTVCKIRRLTQWQTIGPGSLGCLLFFTLIFLKNSCWQIAIMRIL
jgi:hypothetical protein